MRNTNTLIAIAALAFTVQSRAQDATFDFKRLDPSNPNVASLIKPTLTPVTEYAGIPNISIPLCAVQEDNISLPISLNYHAGGIQVPEESGNVGLGWACSAGGVITRTVYDIDDLSINTPSRTWVRTRNQMPDYPEYSNGQQTFFNPLAQKFVRVDQNLSLPIDGEPVGFDSELVRTYSRTDFMPDMFHFNFAGHSGSFILRQDDDLDGNLEVFLLEKSGIHVQVNHPADTGIGRHTFTITVENGTKYHFNEIALTTSNSDPATTYVSSWYLGQIETINHRTIDFTYEELGPAGHTKSYPIRSFVQNVVFSGPLQNLPGSQLEIDDPYLTKIQFSNGEVNFNYSAEGERQDIPFAHYLESIEVVNSAGKTTKRHDFAYSYFGNANAPSGTLEQGDYQDRISYNGLQNPHLNLRLRLDSVTEDLIKTHSFDYYSPNLNQVPNKTSMSQDFWGFHNGIQNLGTFVPDRPVPNYSVPNPASRYPVGAEAKLFSLERITHPTKGMTAFEYESNTYDTTPFANIDEANNSPVSEYDFYIGAGGFPFDVTESPPNTVPREEFAQTLGGATIVSEQIAPATESGVMVRFDLAIYGSQVAPEHRFGNDANNPFDYTQDMYLRIIRNTDGLLVHEQALNSEQAPLDFQNEGQAFLTTTLDFPNLNANGGYTLQAYFNDYNGLYFGMAKITASWEEPSNSGTEDQPLDFAIGGGLRIKSITDLDNTGRIARKRNFDYHYKDTLFDGTVVERSHGKIKTLPDFQMNTPFIPPTNGVPGAPAAGGVIATSSAGNSLAKHQGSYVGYGEVAMTYEDLSGADNGKTVSRYYNFTDMVGRGNNLDLEYLDLYHRFAPIRVPHNGMRFQRQEFKREGDAYVLIAEERSEYRINGVGASEFTAVDFFTTSDFLLGGIIEEMSLLEPEAVQVTNDTPDARTRNTIFQFHPYYATRVELGSSTTIQYDENGQNPVSSTQTTYFDNPLHYMPTRTETVDSEGNTVATQTWYPDDIDTNSDMLDGIALSGTETEAIDLLKSTGAYRRVGQPVQTRIVNKDEKTSQRTQLRHWGNGIVLPEANKTLKGAAANDNTVQQRAVVYSYDLRGNPLEVSADRGPVTSYIWGHNKTHVIAKIVNASYAEIATALGLGEAHIRSFAFDEHDMAEIDALRTNGALPNAYITTYEHDLLVGTTKMTDSRNFKTHYSYDPQRRLTQVRDDREQLISDYKYHYSGQTD